MARLGVFCLEGDWETRLDDRTSVLPMLDMLERLGYIKFIRRDVATRGEFDHYLRRWAGYTSYPLLYLGFHGDTRWLAIDDAEGISLDELTNSLLGAAKGRIIHFGSCATLGVGDDGRSAFRAATGARGVSGYERTVDWVDSAAFELALLQRLAEGHARPSYAYRYMDAQYGERARELGFVHSPV